MLTDCVQALGKIPIDVHGWGIDYGSFSAHKLYRPRRRRPVCQRGQPVHSVTARRASGKRSAAGTESLHNIVGFGAACQDVDKLLAQAEQTRVVKRQFSQRLKAIKPDCVINSPEADVLPNTVSITFPNVDNADLMAMLDYHGIAVSAGSACSSEEDTPSPCAESDRVVRPSRRETIRVSLGWEHIGPRYSLYDEGISGLFRWPDPACQHGHARATERNHPIR